MKNLTTEENFIEKLVELYSEMILLSKNYICLTNYFYCKLKDFEHYNYLLYERKDDDGKCINDYIIIDDIIGVKVITKAEYRDLQINSILED